MSAAGLPPTPARCASDDKDSNVEKRTADRGHERADVGRAERAVTVAVEHRERRLKLVALSIRQLRDERRTVRLLGAVAVLGRAPRRLVERAHGRAHEPQPLHERFAVEQRALLGGFRARRAERCDRLGDAAVGKM